VVKWAAGNLVDLVESGLSPRQYQSLARMLNKLWDDVADNPSLRRDVTILQDALKQDLESIADPGFRTEITKLNRDFAVYMDLLDSPTGKQLGKRARLGMKGEGDDPSRGAPAAGDEELSIAVETGFEFQRGARNADTMFRVVFDSKSPKAMVDLRRLVGKMPFKRAVRRHVEDAFDASVKNVKGEDVIDINVLKRLLGLGGKKNSPEYQTLARALKESGSRVDIKLMDDFFEVAEAQFSLGQIDVSQFVARRFVLGGVKSGLRTFIPGASIKPSTAAASGAVASHVATLTGTIGAVAVIMGMRKLSRKLGDPVLMKAAMRYHDPTLTPRLQHEAKLRFVRLATEAIVADQRQDAKENLPATLGFGAGAMTRNLDRIQRGQGMNQL
jgi:hypothetical protein